MFLLFGTRASETVLTMVVFVCSNCGVSAAQRVFTRKTKVTLFFVPLFTVSTSHWNECSHCGLTTQLTQPQVDNALAWTPR